MTSIFEGQPPKTRSFPIKTRGPIWVPGIYIYTTTKNILIVDGELLPYLSTDIQFQRQHIVVVKSNNNITKTMLSGWWFQIFFIFTPTWGNDPI